MASSDTPSFEDIILASYGSADPRILGSLQDEDEKVYGLVNLVAVALAALESAEYVAETLAELDLLDRGEAAVVALVWLGGVQLESPELIDEAASLLVEDRRLTESLAVTAAEIDDLRFLAALADQDLEAAAEQLAVEHLELDRIDRTLLVLGGLLAASVLVEGQNWSRWRGRYRETRRYLRRLSALLETCP